MKKFPTLRSAEVREISTLLRSRADFLFELSGQIDDLWRTAGKRTGDSPEAEAAREELALIEARMYIPLRSIANILADQAVNVGILSGQLLAGHRDQILRHDEL